MKKTGLLIIIILLIAGIILFYSGSLDTWRVQGVINGVEKAMEEEESTKMMSFISLNYADGYGFDNSKVKRLLENLFKDFDKFEVTIENPVIEIKEDTATVKFDVRVTVGWNGNPSYIVGTNRSAAHIRAYLVKELFRWKVVRVEGVK
ncbi:MAG: hypothetical protein IT392_08455 [Nitrospirae bacterium]|nr:hypothetical protein [Nitrospirota bacterium]